MPTYEYECEKCGGQFEARHSYENKLTACTLCSGGPVSILISGGAEAFVKGRPIQTGHKHKIRPIGWDRGNTDVDSNVGRHGAEIRELRKQTEEQRRSCGKKSGIRLIASYPTELAAARMSEFGKDYLLNDVEDKAKRDGVWLGE